MYCLVWIYCLKWQWMLLQCDGKYAWATRMQCIYISYFILIFNCEIFVGETCVTLPSIYKVSRIDFVNRSLSVKPSHHSTLTPSSPPIPSHHSTLTPCNPPIPSHSTLTPSSPPIPSHHSALTPSSPASTDVSSGFRYTSKLIGVLVPSSCPLRVRWTCTNTQHVRAVQWHSASTGGSAQLLWLPASAI